MSEKSLPFYAQAAVLDKYIHSIDPAKEPEVLAVLLDMLRNREDLKTYFFRSEPSVAWASILYEHGFLTRAPSPVKEEKGFTLPYWYEQGFLISVASEVPEIVVKHVQSIEGDGWYIALAIEALLKIEADRIKEIEQRIIHWLNDPEITPIISKVVSKLVKKLVLESEEDCGFSLFRALTEPKPPREIKKIEKFQFGNEAVSKLRDSYEEDHVIIELSKVLSAINPARTTDILELHLLVSLDIEQEIKNVPEYKYKSYWRSAIEETDQDLHQDYKGKLLNGLRNSISDWLGQKPQQVKPLLQRYLNHEREIFRRLGLYVLAKWPLMFREELRNELLRFQNLNEMGIHHEFFILLKNGFQHLDLPDQEKIIEAIRMGPPAGASIELARWAEEQYGLDRDEYIENHKKRWIRDRLFMIRGHIGGPALGKLNELISELGTPEHPDFTRWHSGVYWVRDVSPKSEEELREMEPEDLFEFVRNWRPDHDHHFGPERLSYEGLAAILTNLVLSDLERYENVFEQIFLYRAENTCAFFEYLRSYIEKDEEKPIPWEFCLLLAEKLLQNKTARDELYTEEGGNWVWARKRIVDFLGKVVAKRNFVPSEHLPRIKDILLILINDSDPDQESDRPEQGVFGQGDPATVAINHVRPVALSSLIQYALEKAIRVLGIENQGPGVGRIEQEVQEELTRKLNKKIDTSWAVHSVYGRYLWTLFWLDKDWVVSRIDQIFPESPEEESMWYFIAAWDSFVIFNNYNTQMIDILRPKYKRAIENLRKGFFTETHLRPIESLSNHLILDYLHSDEDIHAPKEKQPLLASLFEAANADQRGSACWVLWKMCQGNPRETEAYWPKIRRLWEWRIQVASAANHTSGFDNEMQWLAQLILVAPAYETIKSLWPLLEGVLPHIQRDKHGLAWRSLEEYLAKEVDQDPERAIQYYYMMYYKTKGPPLMLKRDYARKIIETAAESKIAREKALSLIDLLARLNIHEFRDIYDHYCK
jgi:hypothetical protein